MTKTLIALLLIACLLLTACTSDQVTTFLELAVDAAIAAAPAIETASGVDPQTQAVVATYLQLVQSCLGAAQVSIGTATKITAAQVAGISAACSVSILKSPALPPGTSANTVAAVSAVASALSTFLNALPKQQMAFFSHPDMVRAFSGYTQSVKVDKKRLARIQKKLDNLKAKLDSLKPKGATLRMPDAQAMAIHSWAEFQPAHYASIQ